MIEINKVIDKYANDIDEKIIKTNVQNIGKMLHNYIFNSLNKK